MLNTHRASDLELAYAIDDIDMAIAAMPSNPKVREYLDDRSAASGEIWTRAEKRTYRYDLAHYQTDPLTATGKTLRERLWRIQDIRHQNENPWTRKRWHAASFNIGWRKRRGRHE